jgi:pyruvate dehydrogenase E1 component alpha subunit
MQTLNDEQQLEAYRRMRRIRLFEDAILEHRSEIPSVVHLSVGMEASIVGACMALRADDYMVGTHRSHGHPIGKGAEIDRLCAELLGKVTGVNRGKGGSMHLSDFSVGSLGETSIVGSGLPVATGAALGAQMQGQDRVALCFFGDGAAQAGTFHESLNIAGLWKLPAVYVCENNGYGELTAVTDACAGGEIVARAAGYGLPGIAVDGQDFDAVHDAVTEAVERARRGDGASLVETKTYRYYGHSGGPEPAPNYRELEEVEAWLGRDPIELYGARLVDKHGVARAVLDAIDTEEVARVEAAWEFARQSPYPDTAEIFEHLYTNRIDVGP